MEKQIEIVVDPQGNSTVETKGYVGSECHDASRFLEAALGTTTNSRNTAAFYQSNTQQQIDLEH